jgi:rhomboid protease GluP
MGGFTAKNVLLVGGYESDLVNHGQIWRLLTYAVVHWSYSHFFLNMVFIIIFSRPLEQILGKGKFLFSYLFLSIFTGVFIYFFSTDNSPSAGSSGIGYGLLGMYVYLISRHGEKFPIHEKKFIIMFVLIGFAMTVLLPNISLSGHIGGFIGGIILSFFIFNRENSIRFSTSYDNSH